MTRSQWQHFLPKVTIPNGAVRILDYGCGQRLAGILLFELSRPRFRRKSRVSRPG
jgi:hypothetical protein